MSGPYRSLPVVNGPVCVDCMHHRLRLLIGDVDPGWSAEEREVILSEQAIQRTPEEISAQATAKAIDSRIGHYQHAGDPTGCLGASRQPRSRLEHCVGGDRVINRPARRDYVTGRDHPPDYRMVACSSKNGSGECLDFEAKEPIVDTRSRSRRLRDRLIRWWVG